MAGLILTTIVSQFRFQGLRWPWLGISFNDSTVNLGWRIVNSKQASKGY